MANKQIINTETGEFAITDNFAFSAKTTTEDLIAHFGADKLRLNDMQNGHKNYAASAHIEKLYFIFTFYFFDNLITHISFYLLENFTPQDESNNTNASWDNFDVAEAEKEGQFMKKWLNSQLNGVNNFSWGIADVYYDPHNLSYSGTIGYRNIKGEKLK